MPKGKPYAAQEGPGPGGGDDVASYGPS
jgi:hypothetical protein